MLPAFVLAGRLDAVEVIGALVEEVVAGPGGVRPAAERGGVVKTKARGGGEQVGCVYGKDKIRSIG
jgi:hypothetical protein